MFFRRLFAVLAAASLASLASAIACSSGSGGTDSGDAPTDTYFPEDVNEGPFLVELSVTTTKPSSLTLVPAFASTIHDYYVRCGTGQNELTLSMTAGPGAMSALLRPKASPPAPHHTFSVRVREGEAIVATATVGQATTEYWVRCLPHDSPPLQFDPHPEAGAPPPGYYLLGTEKPPSGTTGYAIILDGKGVPVWYVSGRPKSGVGCVDNILSGTISFFSGAGLPCEIRHLSPLETVYAAPQDTTFDPHELQVLPNGNFIGLSNPIVGGIDLTGLDVPVADGGFYHPGPNSTIALCNLVEFDSTGSVVWTWVGEDHLDSVKDSVVPSVALGTLTDGTQVIDPYHCNSIDVDPANGNLLVSAREMDSVFYVERPSGNVLWKMGGKSYTKDDAPYVPVADPFYRQHDARLLPGWSTCAGGRGQVSVFDDHSYVSGPARGVVYDVTVGSGGDGTPGDAGLPDCGSTGGGVPKATVAWQYAGQANSASRGSFRVTPDGSRVIGWGVIGAPNVTFTEVDLDGHDLLDFTFSDGDVSYRVVKVPTSALDLAVLRNTAGLP